MSSEPSSSEAKLPVHGFVLAGGKSSRMGRDKALLPFRGKPMVEIAVEKLRSFCSDVSIAGNRADLSTFAPVAFESRVNCGPAAGIEAGLHASCQPWALFIPVDTPLVPIEFLRMWVDEALRADMAVSYLAAWRKQPAFCLCRLTIAPYFSAILDTGVHHLEHLLTGSADRANIVSWMYNPFDLYGYPDYAGPDEATFERWFSNLNTPEELQKAEMPY